MLPRLKKVEQKAQLHHRSNQFAEIPEIARKEWWVGQELSIIQIGAWQFCPKLPNVHRLMGSYCFSGSWGTHLRWEPDQNLPEKSWKSSAEKSERENSICPQFTWVCIIFWRHAARFVETHIFHSLMLEPFILVFSNLICWNVSSLYIWSDMELT